MSSYQYRKSHYGDKTILRPSYLHNGISYTGKMTSLYWIGTLMFSEYIPVRMQPLPRSNSRSRVRNLSSRPLCCKIANDEGSTADCVAWNGNAHRGALSWMRYVSKVITLWPFINWDRDKIAAILQTAFSNTFSWIKTITFWFKSHLNIFQRFNWQHATTGSDKSLVSNRRQALIWANIGLVCWCIHAPLGLDKIICFVVLGLVDMIFSMA